MVVFDMIIGNMPVRRQFRVMTLAGMAYSRDPPAYGFQSYYLVLFWQRPDFARITPAMITHAWISLSGNLLIRTRVNDHEQTFILEAHYAPLMGV